MQPRGSSILTVLAEADAFGVGEERLFPGTFPHDGH